MKYFSLIVCSIVVCFAMPDQAFAQQGRKGVNQTFRYLGAFHSAGYHWRTPGPCVNYYNPYSSTNSTLLTAGQPQGLDPYQFQSPFSQPSRINDWNAPAVQPGQNILPAEVEKLEFRGRNEKDETTDLEKEVQSIMEVDEMEQKDGVPSGTTGNRFDDSLWPGLMNFEADNSRRVKSSNSRRSKTATSVLTHFTYSK